MSLAGCGMLSVKAADQRNWLEKMSVAFREQHTYY
jgi:hypothetical protein